MTSKITMLSGDTTPAVFIAKLAEIADEIEGIACVVHHKDGKTSVFHTSMNNIEKSWMRWVFDQDFRPENPE